MKSANKERELQSGMTAINHVVNDLRTLGGGSPDVDAYESSLTNISLARQLVDAAQDSPERQAAQEALQNLFEDFDQLACGEREPDAEGIAASLAGALRAQSFINALQPIIAAVPHKLIHMSFESNRWLPRRNHGDHDQEKYLKRLEAFFLEQLEKDQLAYIAVIPAADGPQGLSEVFARSNSIDAPWIENEGVKLHPWLGGQRSTSVGDLVVVRDQVQMVDSFGFTNLSRIFDDLQEKLIAPIDAQISRTASRERRFDFKSPLGIPMQAVLTLKGETSRHTGREPSQHEDPVIAFMDMRHWPEKGGQKMSSYFLSTFFSSECQGAGLCLDGGVPEWELADDQVRAVAGWARGVLGITPEREMACTAIAAELFSALDVTAKPDSFSGGWVTSTDDRLMREYRLEAGGRELPTQVVVSAVFEPGTAAVSSVDITPSSGGEALARYEADDDLGVDLDSERPDFSM